MQTPTLEEMDLTLLEYCKSKDDCKKKCALYDEETRCLRSPDRIEQNYWKLYALGELKRMEIKKKMSDGSVDYSLCWKCSRASNGCAWSISFKPVDGWDAEPTVINYNGRITDSYFVKSCPHFVHDKRLRASDLNDEGVAELCGALVKLAARDYENLLEREKAFTHYTTKEERDRVAFDKRNCESVLPDEVIENIKNGIPIKTRNDLRPSKRRKKKK